MKCVTVDKDSAEVVIKGTKTWILRCSMNVLRAIVYKRKHCVNLNFENKESTSTVVWVVSISFSEVLQYRYVLYF